MHVDYTAEQKELKLKLRDYFSQLMTPERREGIKMLEGGGLFEGGDADTDVGATVDAQEQGMGIKYSAEEGAGLSRLKEVLAQLEQEAATS